MSLAETCFLDVSAAVAARFGIGRDFWLNLLLTICGYIPGKSFTLMPYPSQLTLVLQGMSTTSTYK